MILNLDQELGFIKEIEFMNWVLCNATITNYSDNPWRYKGRVYSVREIYIIYSNKKQDKNWEPKG